MGLNFWLSPYTANKTTKTTYLYVQQAPGGPPPPGQPAQPVQYAHSVQQVQHIQHLQQAQHVQHVQPVQYQQQHMIHGRPVAQYQQHMVPAQQVYQAQPVQHIQHQVQYTPQPQHQYQVASPPPTPHILHQQQSGTPYIQPQQPCTPHIQAYRPPPPASQHQYSPISQAQHPYPPSPAPPTPQMLHPYASIPSTPYMEHNPPPAYSSAEAQSVTAALAQKINYEKLPMPMPFTASVADEKKPYPPMTVEPIRIPMPEPSAGFPQKQTSVSAHIEAPVKQQQEQQTAVPPGSQRPQRNPQTYNDNSMATPKPSMVSHSVAETTTPVVRVSTRPGLSTSAISTSSSSTQPATVGTTASATISSTTPTSSQFTRPTHTQTYSSSSTTSIVSQQSSPALNHSQPPASPSQTFRPPPTHTYSTSSTAPTASAAVTTPQTYQPLNVQTPSISQTYRPPTAVPTQPASQPFRPPQPTQHVFNPFRPQQRPLAAQTYQPPPTHSHTEVSTATGIRPVPPAQQPSITTAAAKPHAMDISQLIATKLKQAGLNKNFMDSKDDVPRLFLIAPTLEEPLVRGPYRPIRILLPCQAPSSLNGDEESVHMTSHNGYTIKNPNDFLHNNRDTVKLMSTITSYFARAAAVGSQYQAALGVVGDLAATAAAFYAANADNRTHLNTAGLDTDSLYEMHLATENHQREALKILLMAAAASDRTQSMTGELNGIVLNNGRTIWVCKECYDHMLKGESIMDKYHVSLSDYETLTKRGPEVKVTLRSSASLIIFTNALWNNPETRNVTIRIVSEYFETPERSHRAALSSIQSLFSDLGQALASKRLTHLEIHGNSVSGAIYSNLQCVLKCSTLERLSIQGFPRFLQGANLPKDCKLLTKLMLDNVLIDTEEAANNFRGLMHANPGINHLRLSRAGFTHAALSVLFLVEGTANKAISVPKLFMRLVQLSLSDNNMDQISALTFVRMAFLSVNLTHLDLSGNPMIGDPGCRAIMTLLKEKSRKLVELKTERTGTEMRTRMELDQILSKSCS